MHFVYNKDFFIATFIILYFRIPRNEFLLRVKKAMLLVQEGVRCKSCVKINRTNKNEGADDQSSKFDDLVDEMSDSSYDSSYLSDSSYSTSLY